MSAILNAILCFLRGMIGSFNDLWLSAWDSVLTPADAIVASIGTGGLNAYIIPPEYTWLLGATGLSQALTIFAGALGVRFILQTVPFVRWGS